MKGARKPLVIGLFLAILAAAWLGLGPLLRLETFLLHKQVLSQFVADRMALAMLAYAVLYIVVVAFSLPFALPLSLIGGVLFGWFAGSILTAVAATIGAVLLFLAARGLFHAYFVRKTESWLGGMRREFHADAAPYLLLLRLTPLFPFAVVNLAAALLGARLGTYLWTTFVGILPGTIAFTLTGAGLGNVLEQEAESYRSCLAAGRVGCRADLDPSTLISRELILGLAALGLVMILSILAKRILRRREKPMSATPADGQLDE